MNKIDNLLEGMSNEISKIGSTRNLPKIIRCTYCNRAITAQKNKNNDCPKCGKKKVKKGSPSFKELLKQAELGEANIEIKDPNGKNITINGKPYVGGIAGLKNDYPKHFIALKRQLLKDKKSLKNFGGDDLNVDIMAKSDGTIIVNYDA